MKLCECGCGQAAPIAKKTVSRLGHRKGEPIRFIMGHQCRAAHVRAARLAVIGVGPNSPAWRGGRHASHRAGYVRVYSGRGGARKLEHRVIAEQTLGRPLTADEIVHHANHVKTDNSPANLKPMTNSEHLRLHTTERWTQRKAQGFKTL